MVERTRRNLTPRKIDIFHLGRWHKSSGSAGVTFTRKSVAHVPPLLAILISFWLVCSVAWAKEFAGGNPDPRFWTLLTLFVTCYGGFEIFRLRPRLHQTRTSAHMGEVLDRLRGNGFGVVSDVPAENGKVDYVVVGPGGIYAIAMKNRSGSGTIEHSSNNELIFGGRITDNRPLGQARDAASALQAQLPQNYFAKPVLVFAGDWQVRRDAGDYDVDVVTADALEKYFERQQPELTQGEIASISSHLQRPAGS